MDVRVQRETEGGREGGRGLPVPPRGVCVTSVEEPEGTAAFFVSEWGQQQPDGRGKGGTESREVLQ